MTTSMARRVRGASRSYGHLERARRPLSSRRKDRAARFADSMRPPTLSSIRARVSRSDCSKARYAHESQRKGPAPSSPSAGQAAWPGGSDAESLMSLCHQLVGQSAEWGSSGRGARRSEHRSTQILPADGEALVCMRRATLIASQSSDDFASFERLGDVPESGRAKIGSSKIEAALDLPMGILKETNRARRCWLCHANGSAMVVG
jgi:hypothetical protein